MIGPLRKHSNRGRYYMPDSDVLSKVSPTCTARNSKSSVVKDHLKAGALVRKQFKQKKLVCRIDACATMCSDKVAVQYIQGISQRVKQKTTEADEVILGCSLLSECLAAIPALSNQADRCSSVRLSPGGLCGQHKVVR